MLSTDRLLLTLLNTKSVSPFPSIFFQRWTGEDSTLSVIITIRNVSGVISC